MKQLTYLAESAAEEHHWWFVGRRILFGRIIDELGLPSNAAILDIGTSTGTNLRLLREMDFSNVYGIDPSEEAIRLCQGKGLGAVTMGSIHQLPFESCSFDLVLLTDVLEHLDDDLSGLREIERVLKRDGLLLITVPAFSSLWGPQDIVAEHKRRYRMPHFKSVLQTSGFKIVELFYFNYLLFIPIFLARKFLLATAIPIRSENDINSRGLNWVLTKIFSLDILTARRMYPPFGVSILGVVRKCGSQIVR